MKLILSTVLFIILTSCGTSNINLNNVTDVKQNEMIKKVNKIKLKKIGDKYYKINLLVSDILEKNLQEELIEIRNIFDDLKNGKEKEILKLNKSFNIDGKVEIEEVKRRLKEMKLKKELSENDVLFIKNVLFFIAESSIRNISLLEREILINKEKNKNKFLFKEDELKIYDKNGNMIFNLTEKGLKIYENNKILFGIEDKIIIFDENKFKNINELDNVSEFENANKIISEVNLLEKESGKNIFGNLLTISTELDYIEILDQNYLKNIFDNGLKIGDFIIKDDMLQIGNLFFAKKNYIQIGDFKIKVDGLYKNSKKIKDILELQNENFKISYKEINFKNKIIINNNGIKFFNKKIDERMLEFGNKTILIKNKFIFNGKDMWK